MYCLHITYLITRIKGFWLYYIVFKYNVYKVVLYIGDLIVYDNNFPVDSRIFSTTATWYFGSLNVNFRSN